MRKRLERYIGGKASEVRISTFHSYAIGLIEKHYLNLGFTNVPKLLDERGGISCR